MHKQMTTSNYPWVVATILFGLCLVNVDEVNAQQSYNRFTQRGYYNGLGGRVVNPSHQNYGGYSTSGRHYTLRYPTSVWASPYSQQTHWRATPYSYHYPYNSLGWGQGHSGMSFGTGRYYGVRYQVSQSSFYNPYGQTRWYW